MPTAVAACLLSDLKEGEGKCVFVEGKPVALFLVEGSPYAIGNTCPHRGAPLSRGTLEGAAVRCPLHGWTFDLKSGESLNQPGQKVATFRAAVRGEEVWVETE